MKNTNELYSGCFITLFFGLIIWIIIPSYIDKVNFLPPSSPGPDAWPKIVAYFGFLLGLLLLITSIYKRFFKINSMEQFSLFTTKNFIHVKRFFYLLILFLTYYLSIPIFGIILASSFFLGAILTSNKKNKKTKILISLFSPIFLYITFTKLTNTPFPIGSIWSTFGLN